MAQVISNTGNEADSAMKENRFLKPAWTHSFWKFSVFCQPMGWI